MNLIVDAIEATTMPRHRPPPSATEAGTALLETIWSAFANRIVEKAIQIYSVPPEKSDELRAKYTRRGDYRVISKEDSIRKTAEPDS